MPVETKKLAKESIITILTLLKDFYDEGSFNYLAREIYNPDLDISLTAIRSSAVIGNEAAIPHLYKIIEKGKPPQRLEALKALAVIRAPSSVERLIKYYSLFAALDVRREIILTLGAINAKTESYKKFIADLILDPHNPLEIQQAIFPAVVNIAERELLLTQKKTVTPQIEKYFIKEALRLPPQLAQEFFHDASAVIKNLDPEGRGYFLAGYLLFVNQPDHKFIITSINAKGRSSLAYFLQALLDHQLEPSRVQRLFKILLILPYTNNQLETLIGRNFEKIISLAKERSSFIAGELASVTAAHLEALMAKIRKNYLSLSSIQQKEGLIPLIFARLVENYATPSLLDDILRYFKGFKGISEEALRNDLKNALSDASEEEKNQLKACLILIGPGHKPEQMKAMSLLANVDLSRPSLLRRLNRFVRLAGVLGLKQSLKTLQRILDFAHGEHLSFLEETTIVTLCQLADRLTLEKARQVFQSPQENLTALRGYLRGLKFCEQKPWLSERANLLLRPDLSWELKLLILEGFLNLSTKEAKPVVPLLVKALFLPQRPEHFFEFLNNLLCQLAEGNAFQVMLGLLNNSKDTPIRIFALKVLRQLVMRDIALPRDVLVNRFYLLLEDPDPEIRQETLASLLYLKDDYAIQVLKDYFKDDKIAEAPALLARIPQPYSREVVLTLFKQLDKEHAALQMTMRSVLKDVAKTELAEELRTVLVNYLTQQEGTAISFSEGKESSEQFSVSLEQAKMEFKFKRENSQILTVFFCDIVSYTEKSSFINTSTLMKLIHSFEGIVLPLIKEYRGQVIKTLGDGILAIFKHPLNAVVAALAIQKKVAQYNAFKLDEERFQLRIGLNTGQVIRKAGDIFGDVVNVASRMQAAAEAGDILLTYETYKEIQNYVRCTPLGRIKVKGKEEAIAAYSAQEVKVDLKQLLGNNKDPTANNSKSQTQDAVLNLKESMYRPNFTLPPEINKGRLLLDQLNKFFNNLTNAIEEISEDYHDEYTFKKYLQKEWDLLTKNWDRYFANGKEADKD